MSVAAGPTWAVVPVKPFDEAKSRLKPLLPDDVRRSLATRLLDRTLGVLALTPSIDQIVVTSRDEQALAMARAARALPVAEPDRHGLNFAVQRAAAMASLAGAANLLVIASDLPLLSPQDLKLLFAAGEACDVVIAPDRHGSGTNALLLRPPGVISPSFGLGSFERHGAQSRGAGIEPSIVRTQGLGFDLDLPSDYEDLLRIAPEAWSGSAFLAGLSA